MRGQYGIINPGSDCSAHVGPFPPGQLGVERMWPAGGGRSSGSYAPYPRQAGSHSQAARQRMREKRAHTAAPGSSPADSSDKNGEN